MPHFKTIDIGAYNKIGYQKIRVKVAVSARNGDFYCNLDEEYLYAARSVFDKRLCAIDGKIKVASGKFADLERSLEKMFKLYISADVIETPVIRYSIVSRVSFAEDDKGNVMPNAGFSKSARWREDTKEMYTDGATYSFEKSGGHILKIAARAALKKTYKFGDTEKVEYESYYKGGSHLIYENPAQLLNAWTGINFNKNDVKEIPYSDKAALFFHNLLLGMARLSKIIQESTFDQDNLLRLIDKEKPLLFIGHNNTDK